ncbi:glutamate receptor 3.1 [Physcomitrium patens]|uniref:Receptor ligand binding region domain-containing protein n=1 Tax=Physcomitrium patens TaxID=3218 RepID=A0A2K1JPD8_PHYPA|nr:glutamate receptor 3.4-like [Physcomitrium patens]XP_024390832.1 glutamate receptor 3.4-like [Physcomitrium patens]XP_024390834.1 glutamate receptor 3.4-like [Physcomitrium patens]XP_024390835.1 glutamate receptor 3.4-like [Physcomitrium patens]XP_024390836.1 glutamate receptor 3.4-like [Physcomitrium patens]XP_024390837.1 glutamate receptor 3.4-like [Physcomitrium patens]XP_024390838.1 glutamate receptor 3.4-like [Physcomitrium patens]XP_024390839.1 glutamate receptor 3.4-like [Physcomit|eukprot:XP_024390831.1 glutamate receptor 3.4-like [Physcomitrella patens]
MARNGKLAATLHVVVLCMCLRGVIALDPQNITYRIGFLSPSPDSIIPTNLAIEWNSAFQVAMEVLNAENRPYTMVSTLKSSECDWQLGQQAAESLLRPTTVPPLIGAVGPACTDAAMSAGRAFVEHNYPLVSFAATSESLSNRDNFPTFFRTVFSDRHQAAAIAASVSQLKIKRLTVLTTQHYYSMNLGSEIVDAVGNLATINTFLLHRGANSTLDITELAGVLDKVGKDEFVVMAVQPIQAYEIWKAAYKLDRIRWPFWYFGTDGVTAFDPQDNSTDPNLVSALQGEIGISPHGGDLNNPACEKFYSYWKSKKYPGFPSEGKNRTRSYVPQLIDAVQTYFHIVDNLIKANLSVTKENVFQALNSSGLGTLKFEGCSGIVSFDPASGSRSVVAQVPQYDLMSLTPAYWEVKGEIMNGSLVGLQLLKPPGSEYGPNSTYMGPNPNGLSSKTKIWIIAGTFAGACVLSALVGGAVHFHRRQKHPAVRTESMRRFIDFGSFRGGESFRAPS